MKADRSGWILWLALVSLASCGGGGQSGTDTGRDTADQGDPGAEQVQADVSDLVSADMVDARSDADPGPDANLTDDQGGGFDLDAPPEISGKDLSPEPGDACEGPECVPCPDDDLECTEVARDDTASCIQVLKADWCLIEGACIEKDAVDPTNPCRTCQPDTDTEAFVAEVGLPCDDPTPCSPGGQCTALATCALVLKPCDDGNSCTYDYCVDGSCTHPHVVSGSCDDGDRCTLQDTCVDGECVGTPKTCTPDNNICTDDACNPATGSCTRTFNTQLCEDGNWCTIDDACSDGNCVGKNRDCSDGTICKKGVCVQQGPGAGICRQDPDPGAVCEDGNLCTSNDMCDENLVCHTGVNRICNDNNQCTDDSCEASVGCIFTQHERGCDDGDPCTSSDRCAAGVCKGSAKDCDDHNPCTSDSCVRGTCLSLAVQNGILCDDGDLCSIGDRCIAAKCMPTAYLGCDDNDACTDDTCVPFVGCSSTPRSCDDGKLCTDDFCDPLNGCYYTANSALCDDDDPCTLNDQCSDSVCAGTPMNCVDDKPCTLDSCVNGVCVHETQTGFCNDGDECTTGERCLEGICQGGWAVTCFDNEVCTDDVCDPTVGCVFPPNDAPCDDRSACTSGDHCAEGSCVTTPVDCDDKNFCTNDYCDIAKGCKYEYNTYECNDGLGCTINDRCSNGVCAGVADVFANPFSKAGTLVMTRNGTAGFGLDVDENVNTCSPSPGCSGGIDNFFGKMGIFLDEQFALDLNHVVVDGRLSLLMEHESPGPGAGPYKLNVLFGQLAAPTTCNPATAGCNYSPFPAEMLTPCQPRYAMANATIVGNVLTAGGKEYQAMIYFAFCNTTGSVCTLVPEVLKWARIRATVTLDGNGKVVGGSGILAGAIDVRKLIMDLDTVPENQFNPYTRDQVRTAMDQRLCTGTECGDLDTDGKTGNDSASIGLPFTIVTGTLL